MRTLAIVLVLMLSCGCVLARETSLQTTAKAPTIDRYDGDGIVGNNDFDDFTGSYYDEFWYGYETYALSFNPAADGITCGEGFSLKAVHMVMVLDDQCEFEVSASLLGAVDDGNGCLEPGEQIATSAAILINGITEFGIVDVEIPFEVDCATANETYFLAINFLDDNGGVRVGLPVTDTATVCRTFNDWGAGFTDLVDYSGFTGDLMIYGDVDCCSNPVANDSASFGTLKALYR